MEHLPHNAAMICAHLIRQGYIKKAQTPTLELDEQLFNEVRNNLSQVGMELVYNSYSPYYAIRLKPSIQETVEQSNNQGLKNNEVAMLVILWSKLILPQRMIENANLQAMSGAGNAGNSEEKDGAKDVSKSPEGEKPQNVVQRTSAEKTKKEEGENQDKIYIRWNELYAEFGEHFGTKTAFKSVLTRLSNLQFIRIHNEIITEGILLDLLVDGYQMANEIKKSALAFKLAGISDEEDWDQWDEEEEDIENKVELEEDSENEKEVELEEDTERTDEEKDGGNDNDV